MMPPGNSPALQRVYPGVESAGVEAMSTQMASAEMVQRVWARDAGMWTSDAAMQQAIRERLGWLDLPAMMPAHAASIRAFAESVRRDGLTHALLIGMGGSSLFPEVCRGIFGTAPGWLDLTVLDTTDPSAILAATSQLPLAKTLVIVSSKSGTTIEVRALCDYLIAQARAAAPSQPGRRFVAITDEGTPLETYARAQAFRQVFSHGPATGRDVGGRFSALTWFGLVPAALIGMDLDRLLARAQAMSQACGPAIEVPANPAASLGAWLAAGSAVGRGKLMIMTSARLAPLGAWIEQLVAESTGKDGQGLLPVVGESAGDAASTMSGSLVAEWQCVGEMDGALGRRVDALVQTDQPVARFAWRDRYDLGGDVVRWAMATSLAAALMQLNPFDEPNVQESKTRTSLVLDAYVARRAWPAEPPVVEGTGEAWGGTDAPGASLEEGLRRLLSRLAPDSYVAVLSFLPRTGDVDAAVATFRRRVAAAGRVTTTLGIGPRYLHAAGQLHKGGPRDAAFIVLTAEDPRDAPIPGWPYSFSVLKRAQAYGDAQALMARGRRVVWAHLGQNPAARLDALSASLGAATS